MTRRTMLHRIAGAGLIVPMLSSGCGSSNGAATSDSRVAAPSSTPTADDDHRLLEEIERAAFAYFWEQASPATGLVKDRAAAAGGNARTVGSIAAAGFGLTALCIGDQRRYAPAADIAARVRATLDFIRTRLPGQNGWFYHFVDIRTGERAFKSEVSSIDTAILLCGVLTCRQHFSHDPRIVELATAIYHGVDFPWMLNGGTTLTMGWKPESGFLRSRWDRYCELMMIYLLGIGSPTHPLPPQTWNAWARPVARYQDYSYISGAPTLFTHQYSHAWFDFRNARDAYADYFQNSVIATRAHKAFCLSLRGPFPDYAENLWGISASDSAHGYQAWGGPPAAGPIDGTIVPCAAGGSVAFLPAETLAVLRNIRARYGEKAWGRYGFCDAFNPLIGWYDPDVLGIDQGIMMLMAENCRTGFVWKIFMANDEVRRAMELAGFR